MCKTEQFTDIFESIIKLAQRVWIVSVCVCGNVWESFN